MFLLNVLLDLTDELNEFCRSFAIQNTFASLFSILAYQINFLHLDFQFPRRLFPPPPHNFDYFQTQKWMLQTVRAEEVDEKMGSFV